MKQITSASKIALVSIMLTSSAYAQENPGTNVGILIAMPISIAAGVSPEEAKVSVYKIVESIRGQPGLLEDKLLMNKSSSNKPSYIHVMRWTSLKGWEMVFSNPKFQEALKDNWKSIRIDTSAGIFEPVNP